MHKEIGILRDFVRGKGLRYTPQREEVLRIFLSIEGHLSLEELYKIIKKKNPGIGYVTVYRTMKLLAEAGLCNAVDFGEGVVRYEHLYEHQHHDHLVCIKCGSVVEVMNPQIERLQDELAKKKKFTALRHKLQIFGICSRCSV